MIKDLQKKLTTSKFRKKFSEKSVKFILFLCAISSIIIIFSIIFFLVSDAIPLFEYVNVFDFLTGEKWNPTSTSNPQFGAFSLIMGSVLVTIGAMIIAIPLSLGSAIFISQLAPQKLKTILKPAVELLAGVPSVIYGYFGLIILVNWLRVSFNEPTGESWLAGSILLGIMAIPTITSVAEDAISSVPRDYKEGSLAVGATRWQTIKNVVVPSSLSGITAAIILGMGRAIGETIAVSMVTGSPPYGNIPTPIWDVFARIKTLTATIASEIPEVARDTSHYHGLFALAVILLTITLVINVVARIILARLRQKHMGIDPSKKTKTNFFTKYFRMFSQKFNRFKKYFKYILGLIFVYILVIMFDIITSSAIVIMLALFYYMNKKFSRKNVQRIWFSILIASIITVVCFLGIILYYIFSNGIGAISPEFVTGYPEDLGRSGGIFPAIIGTLYLVLGAIGIALPLGVGAAIYLTEYKKEGLVTKIIRTAADLLNGTPSIVFGLFGFAFLVLYLEFGYSLIAGQITLAFMILPTIIRTTEEALKSVPQSMREGSYAVGATKWQTIKKVVLPPAAPGIITGSILGIGRAAGETAPIMITAVAFIKSDLPGSFFEPVMALTYHLYALARTIPNSDQAQAGTALILILLVLSIYMVAIVIRIFYNRKMKW